jgi:hypothetical protein
MTKTDITNAYPDAEFLFADGFDEAIIGVCNIIGREPVIAYDYHKCIEILKKDMSYEEAEEYFLFNVMGSYVGDLTPAFIEAVETI